MPQHSLQKQHLSFLALPAELRIAIYEYLIPDKIVHAFDFYGPNNPDYRFDLRHDKQPCCPAILCTNRQIYDEAITMFYESATFIMVIQRSFYFLGIKYDSRDAQLPSNLRLVRSLRIVTGYLLPARRCPLTDYIPPPAPWTKLITDCLSTGPYKLSCLALSRVKFGPTGLVAMIDICFNTHKNLIEEVLEFNLGSLRMLRGVNLEYNGILPLRPGQWSAWRQLAPYNLNYPRHQIEQLFPRMERGRAKFLERLAAEVSKSA